LQIDEVCWTWSQNQLPFGLDRSNGLLFREEDQLMLKTSSQFTKRLLLLNGLLFLVMVSTLARPSAWITYGLIAIAGGMGRR